MDAKQAIGDDSSGVPYGKASRASPGISLWLTVTGTDIGPWAFIADYKPRHKRFNLFVGYLVRFVEVGDIHCDIQGTMEKRDPPVWSRVLAGDPGPLARRPDLVEAGHLKPL